MKKLSLHEPVFAGNEWAYVKECIDTGWVSSAGKFVERFEGELAKRTGTKYGVAVVNGTAALDLALKILGVTAADEVIVPSLTFIATVNAIAYQGATPLFLDVEETTYGLDPDALEAYLARETEMRGGACVRKSSGRRIAACVPMHALGHPVRLLPLLAACAKRSIPVIEDAAEAIGSSWNGRPLGSFGRVGVLSFNGNKILTTGGGGALVTDDESLATSLNSWTVSSRASAPSPNSTARAWPARPCASSGSPRARKATSGSTRSGPPLRRPRLVCSRP
ncbi:MAG: DegT/DnrJ/EryC1/StrS aminotransferase [Elusimicrobia bacterium]|nr:MAG: DegT/DnrJ/EryC1/StrS aminotransferase [Elusimicrobiota bacterium]